MDQQQYPSLIANLFGLIRESGPSWVIRQVAEDFLLNVYDLSDQEIEGFLIRARNPEGVIRSLLNALEITIVETAFMEQEVRNYFLESSQRESFQQSDLNDKVSPLSEIPGETEVFSFLDMSIQGRIQSAEALKSAIDELRDQIG